MPEVTEPTLKIGPRTVLEKGDRFRAKDGPYFSKKMPGGKINRVSMAERGPFEFVEVIRNGRRAWIVAKNKKGHRCMLYIGWKHRPKHLPHQVMRPYVVTGRVKN